MCNRWSILCFLYFLLAVDGSALAQEISPSDPSHHPVYSTYSFAHSTHILSIGTQPYYLPAGLIAECMKRDRLFHDRLESLGLVIRFFSFMKGDDINFFLQKGDLQGAMGGDMPALVAAATQKIVCTSLVQQGFTSLVADRPMFIGELRGKRIGYALGSNAHYALLYALSSEGLSPEDVRLIPMDVAAMPEALETGRITAFSAWEPTPAVALEKVKDAVVIHRSLNAGYLYFLKETLRDHPEAVRLVLAAEIRAIRWMRRGGNLLQASRWTIESGDELFRRRWPLSPEQVAALSKKDLLQFDNAPIIPENSLKDSGVLHKEFLFLQEMGKIPVSVSWPRVRESFDRDAISDVLSHPAKYSVNRFDYRAEPEKYPHN